MEAPRAAGKPLRQPAPLTRPTDRAFEQLYRRHAREVYQYALALLANPTDAEDVTQTTFLNAYRAFQRGERPRKPHNWLIAIAHNVCRMRWRQAGARPREVALDEAPEPLALEHERPNLDGVLTALAALSFNQRAALVMRELEGRSYQEISDVLGVSVSAVEALLFRARRRLQIHRKALGVISTAPLPGSLTSFLGAGGGATATGGTAIGASLVLKAAAVVVAGAVTAGVGYRSLNAVTGSREVASPQAHAATPEADRAAKRSHAKTTLRHRPRLRHATASARPTRPTAPSGQATAPAKQPAQPTASAAVTPPSALPKLTPPALSKLPPPPVTPTLPQLPITVPAPKLPPPPPLPPLPPPPPIPLK